jgi:hypothetical protein
MSEFDGWPYRTATGIAIVGGRWGQGSGEAKFWSIIPFGGRNPLALLWERRGETGMWELARVEITGDVLSDPDNIPRTPFAHFVQYGSVSFLRADAVCPILIVPDTRTIAEMNSY